MFHDWHRVGSKRYSSAQDQIQHQIAVGGQCHATAVLLTENSPGTQHIVDKVGLRACLDMYGEETPPLGLEPWTVQPATSHCPIQAPKICTASSHYIY